MTVLILTHAEDRTADRVAAELALRGVPVARIDQADISLRVAVDGHIGSHSRWCGRLRDRESGAVIADTEGLVRLHRDLGLMYGAADLACDMAGRYWFLETNQAGEWGWLAEQAGLPIAQALADLLAADNRP